MQALTTTPNFKRKKMTRIGPYLLENRLGKGSFATVRAATHRETGDQVALKIIYHQPNGEDDRVIVGDTLEDQMKTVQRVIQREVRSMQAIGYHPHCLSLKDVLTLPHMTVLVLEKISGGDLFHWIHENTPDGIRDEQLARRLAYQLVSALAHCHEHLVAHRDVKPENIMITEDCQRLVLFDYGLSDIMNGYEIRGQRFFRPMRTYCGSANYVAPEILLGQPYHGPAVDAWSLGVTLYVMRTARFPWSHRRDDVEQVQNALKGNANYGTLFTLGVDDQCIRLITSLLSVNPLERPTMVQVLQHPWFHPPLPSP